MRNPVPWDYLRPRQKSVTYKETEPAHLNFGPMPLLQDMISSYMQFVWLTKEVLISSALYLFCTLQSYPQIYINLKGVFCCFFFFNNSIGWAIKPQDTIAHMYKSTGILGVETCLCMSQSLLPRKQIPHQPAIIRNKCQVDSNCKSKAASTKKLP